RVVSGRVGDDWCAGYCDRLAGVRQCLSGDEHERRCASRIPKDRSELLSACVVAAAVCERPRELRCDGSPSAVVCGRAEDQSDRAVGSNTYATCARRGREQLADRETDLQVRNVDAARGRVARLDRAWVALDVARVALLVEVVERQPSVPRERFAQRGDLAARLRMINAQAGRGGRADSDPGLHARVSGHQTPTIKQTLNLAVLADGGLLRHHRPAGLLEQLALRIRTRALIGHQPHTAPGCAESGLEPVRERQTVEVALPADE